MSMPKSKFWSPTKEGKIYAGILSVIVVLVSWFMAINSLFPIDDLLDCDAILSGSRFESTCLSSSGGVMTHKVETGYINLLFGICVGIFFVIGILFASVFIKNRVLNNQSNHKILIFSSYYLFIYFIFLCFAFLWFPLLNTSIKLLEGSKIGFLPSNVIITSIGSLMVALVATLIGYLMFKRQTRNTKDLKVARKAMVAKAIRDARHVRNKK